MTNDRWFSRKLSVGGNSSLAVRTVILKLRDI